MGERLALSFFDDTGKRFLSSCYQRSAFTDSMLYEVNRVVRKYRNYMNEFEEDSPKKNLLEALYDLDAGLE